MWNNTMLTNKKEFSQDREGKRHCMASHVTEIELHAMYWGSSKGKESSLPAQSIHK